MLNNEKDETLSNLKSQLRQDSLARRDALSPALRQELSLAIARHGSERLPEIASLAGMMVSGFLPIRSEVDLRPLMAQLRHAQARLCLPVVLDRQTICFREWRADVALTDTGFGTSGPGPDAPVVDPDLLLMPLAAFDRNGNRIGYGAGHYDRAISRLRDKGRIPVLIGIAFSCQEVAEVPFEPHDVPLQAILTEHGLRTVDI
ncbi:5-formyltetrahydrofolate cyclo-ligase [Allorhizobium taibaishanense]|uniref:5-formyltetrahydrofolate cyclo-ligase n=1 Tax=Allorhizobium taibaishanense TaxID=887144 RepID=A0A1Q9A5S6_9HYPH|nr:5-formyltetrahydrofolate cyclo-ligase [Allorhizobium taibaishanense]